MLPAFGVLAWHIIIIYYSPSFYNSRIDPEYPYLFNGLNCALGNFSNIGHVDHPGTPFQMITGLFLIILHFLFGNGELASDVASRPEFYLTGSALVMAILASFVSWIVTKKIYQTTNNLVISLILGSSLLLYNVALNLSKRYMPDFMLLVIVLALTIPFIQYLINEKYSAAKFSIYSGILIGIGVIVKVNFVPIAIIPFILVEKIKNKLIYVGAFMVSGFINFLPIIKKHAAVRHFLTKISTHDGLYGKGNEQFLNINHVYVNFKLFASHNIWYIIIFLLATTFLINNFIKLKKSIFADKSSRFLLGYILASLAGLLLTLKHYKEYYFGPYFALSIITFAFLLIKLQTFPSYAKYLKYIVSLFLILYLGNVIHSAYGMVKNSKSTTFEKQNFDKRIRPIIESDGYKIMEPSWHFNGTVFEGVLYGLSYVASRNVYYNDFIQAYPDLISWEDENKPLKYSRMLPVLTSKLFYSGKQIQLYCGSHSYKTQQIITFLNSEATKRGINFKYDTIFSDSKNHLDVIQFDNLSNWKTKEEIHCGFETTKEQILYDDKGISKLTNVPFNRINTEQKAGSFALELSKDTPSSPGIRIDSAHNEDYIFVSVKVKGKLPKQINQLIFLSESNTEEIAHNVQDSAQTPVNNNWQLVQLGFKLKGDYNNGLTIYLINKTDQMLLFDDWIIEHDTFH